LDISKFQELNTSEELHYLSAYLEKDNYSEYLEDRLKNKIFGVFEELNTKALPLEECNFGGENLIEKPYNNGKLMDYIACIEGYDFQQNAADQIFLFYDKGIKKAVICLEYT